MLALAWPMAWPKGRDSFPLSSYPMFTSPRTRVTSFALFAVAEGRASRAVPPELVADGTEVMLAVATIRRAARRGRKAQAKLCRRVAEHIAHDNRFAVFDRLELTHATFDPVDYVHHGADAAPTTVLVTCSIER